jgi:hypothetical protein
MTPATTGHTQTGTAPFEETGPALVVGVATSVAEADAVGVAVATTVATVNVIL